MMAIVFYLVGCFAAMMLGLIVGWSQGFSHGAAKAFAIHIAALKEYAKQDLPSPEARNAFFLRLSLLTKVQGVKE